MDWTRPNEVTDAATVLALAAACGRGRGNPCRFGRRAIGLAVLFDCHVERVALADLEDRVLSLIAM
ncbi:hypothetical protein [Paracoccus sp. (in: a-proteobacteria)]|uniref:hypothetical protein n=1 Tax=Paracoccus sp. TaxID=267 RepID=UPI002AFF723A|nr:hypothetical protein [Paracoccus sp. (in: a-proteobacteria)]